MECDAAAGCNMPIYVHFLLRPILTREGFLKSDQWLQKKIAYCLVGYFILSHPVQTNSEFVEFKKSWFRKLSSTVLTYFVEHSPRSTLVNFTAIAVFINNPVNPYFFAEKERLLRFSTYGHFEHLPLVIDTGCSVKEVNGIIMINGICDAAVKRTVQCRDIFSGWTFDIGGGGSKEELEPRGSDSSLDPPPPISKVQPEIMSRHCTTRLTAASHMPLIIVTDSVKKPKWCMLNGPVEVWKTL